MEAYVKALESQGYYKFENVIPEHLLGPLREHIDAGIRIDKLNSHTLGNYSYLAQNKGECFVDLLESSPLQEYIDLILGDTCILHSYNTISLEPNTTNSIQNSIHRDSARFCRPYLLSIQILYMIDDFTLDNGATYVYPGSHLYPIKPDESEFYQNAIQLEGHAGDAVIFDSMLWHAGGINHTSISRRAVTKVFTRPFMKQQIDYTKATRNDVIEKLSPRSLRLLGFHARVPENIDQFFLKGDKRLYRPNQG